MQKFELVLKNEKRNSYDRLAILFFILSAIGMAFMLLYLDPKKIIAKTKYDWLLIAVAFHAAPLVWLIGKKARTNSRLLVYSAIFLAAYWTVNDYWWVGIILILIAFLYKIAQQDLRVIISETNIKYDFFPSRHLQWKDLNNVILKYGLLTIDQKNNKISQNLIDENKTSINEKEFNEFCKQQLNK